MNNITSQPKIFSRLSFAGMSAMLIGNGFGRFAYIAMIPAVIQSGSFTKEQAALMGVAALVGYLFGAPIIPLIINKIKVPLLIKITMILCSISFFACAIEGWSMPWYYFWRTIAGVCGSMLMILTPPFILPIYDSKSRGRVSGIIFSGIGLGVVISGTIIPMLANLGVVVLWLALGFISLLLTTFSWGSFQEHLPSSSISKSSKQIKSFDKALTITVVILLIGYSMDAIGYLPHTLFWVDYIVRELGFTLAVGGFLWSVFGIGAAFGPILAGSFADKFGNRRCLIACFALKATAVALPLVSHNIPSLFVSSFVVGACSPGLIALVSSYTLECVGANHHQRIWGWMTFIFAILQAITGYVMAKAMAYQTSYQPLFFIGAIALLIGVFCILSIRQSKNTSFN